MKLKFRRAACACLSAVMGVTLVSGSVLAFADDSGNLLESATVKSVSFEDVTGKINLNSVALQNLNSSVLENAGLIEKGGTKTVIVSLDEDCLVDSLPKDMTAAEYLNTYTGAKALREIETSQANFLTSLASLGVDYKLVYQYSTVINAVAIEVDTSYISKIKSIKSVEYATVSQTYAYPEDAGSVTSGETSNPNNVYPTGIYNSDEIKAMGYDGSGMTVAILDTGLDYTHPAFSDIPKVQSMTYDSLKDTLAAKNLVAVQLSASTGKSIGAEDLYVSEKVPFAYDYADKDTDVYPSYSQHGVHVAGIVAGHDTEYKDKNGNVVNEDFYGVAPEAQLVICKVFTDNLDSKDLGGASAEDIVAALDDCVMLGVDVINMSLGTSAGFSINELEGDEQGNMFARCYKSIKEAGINLVCAASNDYSSGFGGAYGTNLSTNPDSGTVGSPSTFTGALSVGSINGQLSPFMVANSDPENGVKGSVIYFQDSSDENGKRNDFVKDVLDGATSATFKYVVIGGTGSAGDYTSSIMRYFTPVAEGGLKQPGEKVIAVIKRGSNTFKEKVQIAQDKGADAVIIYNNVAGSIGISIGDLDDPIPAVSVTMDAGTALIRDSATGRNRTTGTIEVNVSYQAGPFMNDYSSWGTTPDLKIKPEVTAHGGEITSAVSGGYAEMSGTSMASPNLAGFVALLRGKIKSENPNLEAVEVTQLVNQLVMSTAVTVYDQDGLPYSPRKQGAGLATLSNAFSTKAYMYTDEENGGAEDNRPKVELSDDPSRAGVYNINFFVKNFGDSSLSFTPQVIFMTETLSSDGLAVAEKAHLLDGNPQIKVSGEGVTYNSGVITIEQGKDAYVQVTLTLSDSEKEYIDSRFKNGMFVEGFVRLNSQSESQCDLNLPFMGFYGDWKAAPMLDYDVFEIADSQKDSSIRDEDKLQASVWATQAYATYYNEKYSVPLGSYVYTQDERAEQIYADAEHVSVSRFNIYEGEDASGNYLTTTSVKALYTGLLRNAELVTYDVYDEDTGELILKDRLFNVSKAYTAGGTGVPANVKLELYPEQLGLVNNGKYRIDLHFYFDAEDEGIVTEDNSYSLAFYVDYEAPILESASIRYYDYKENNKDKQSVYLDLDIYDNHYSQSVILCYGDYDNNGQLKLSLVTDYITPVRNANKNGTTRVSIEITDFYEDYSGRLYVQLDDYALNHTVYQINFTDVNKTNLPDEFDVVGDTEITLGVNQTYKVALSYEGSANLSNFDWTATPQRIASVKNGEIFGVSPGTAVVTVTNPKTGLNKKITVRVVESNTTLSWPSLSFGTIVNSEDGVQKAEGTVSVNAGQDFKLEIVYDPWYYPLYSTPEFIWESDNPTVASVDQNGNVSTWDTKGTANISATILNNGKPTAYAATVTLSVQEPFTISNGSVTAYHGRGGEVKIPNDKNVTSIGTDALKDNDNITSILIPKTVTQIGEGAFRNCTALEEIYFDEYDKTDVPDSSLALILKDAFAGCTSLKKVDLSNVKTITLAARVFQGCTSLNEIVYMENIGTMFDNAFEGCTALKSVDLTGLHNTGKEVFKNCTGLETVITGYYSSIGESIFSGCTSLKEITINAPVIGEYAFENCTNLATVNFGGEEADERLVRITIGSGAFYNCISLTNVNFNGCAATSIGDRAFAKCSSLQTIALSESTRLGIKVFEGTQVTAYADDEYMGAVYSGTTLMLAPATIPAGFEIRVGTTAIADSAFRNCTFPAGYTLVIPESVTQIGTGAFENSNLSGVTLPANLTQIPDRAFLATGLTAVTLPEGLKEIGNYAFGLCNSLKYVTIPASVEVIGVSAFDSSALETLNFVNANSKLTLIGNFAFAGTRLETVSLPDGVTVLYAGVFMDCDSLASVNLNNVTVIGDGAFALCENLTIVTGLNKVTYIGAEAFYATALTSLEITKAQSIGAYAFYGNLQSTVTIPSSLVSLGEGAFANSVNLASFTVENGNDNFFVEDGVLYRVISEGQYEISAYPSAKSVETYEIKEGTVTVLGYAFNGLSGTVNEVKLPYTVKIIGAGAFSSSGIKSYVFESIEAPVLQSEFITNDIYEAVLKNIIIAPHNYNPDLVTDRSMLYDNFESNIQNYLYEHSFSTVAFGGTASTLKISYPSNGTGYENFVYTYFFGTRVSLGELMDDTTRALKTVIEGFYSVAEVESWNNLDNRDEANIKMVSDFSETVKNAHAVYNTITSATQLEYLGAENVQALTDIENALKSVKSRFNIPVNVVSLTVSETSTHKTEYKAGEKFDMTGLQLVVTNDDYSVEQADMSQVSLLSSFDRELTTLDRYVTLQYNGRTVQIRITVTADGGTEEPPVENPPEENPPAEESGCAGGCGSTTLLGGGGGGLMTLGLLGIAFLAATVIRKRKTY